MTRSLRLAIALVGATLALPGTGGAEPLRLRSNALATSQPGAPAGILTLGMDSRARSWLSAEALVWVGAGTEEEADAMVVSVKLLDPKGRGELQLGRFVVIPGAVRPTHLDGGRLRASLPWASSIEVFGGVPVTPGFEVLEWDWVGGGRASRRLGDYGSAGVAYLQRRTAGRLVDEEVGLDVGLAPLPWLDVGGRVAYDLANPGVSDAHASATARLGALRVEGFASHLSPSRRLPATSLFTVLGDVATQRFGASLRWRAAPRLDLLSTVALRPFEDESAAVDMRLQSTLRLDDRGAGALALELRRDGKADDAWTGARASARIPLPYRLTGSTELELVIPDDPRGRGEVWPWGLVALGWRPAQGWQAAAAVEASASPEYELRVDGLVRLTREWGAL